PLESVRFDNLRHGEIAIASYHEFARLKAAGIIPAGTRFLFPIAHPITPIWRFIAEEQRDVVGPRYEEALFAEIEKMCAAIPHEASAIRWDRPSQIFRTLQIAEPARYGNTKAEMVENLSRGSIALGERVPAKVDLVYHLCYGAAQNRHTVEPVHMGDMV